MDKLDKDGNTLLCNAAQDGNVRAIQKLLDDGATIDKVNSVGCTALMVACTQKSPEVVDLLLSRGANPNSHSPTNDTSLLFASVMDARIVHLLLDRGANFDVKNNLSQTPLLRAALVGKRDVVLMLLDRGANMEIKDAKGQTPLAVSIRTKHPPVIELLLERGANVEPKDEHGNTPLFLACKHGHGVDMLLQRGANPNAINKHDETPLFEACRNGHVDAVRLLLGKGATLDHRNRQGATALMAACSYDNAPVIRLLLENVDVDYVTMKDTRGEDAMDIAIRYSQQRNIAELQKVFVSHAVGEFVPGDIDPSMAMALPVGETISFIEDVPVQGPLDRFSVAEGRMNRSRKRGLKRNSTRNKLKKKDIK